ncbi:ATP-binding protein [Paracoccus sp. TOH]|uniref:DEAD/DEAH box helicase n=1 Tax=Paracoccus sp. TOH TaxID=1263728 RepID=UPI0025AFFBC9|nr:ATP-binding protein [Paracoccus sp. TOH]WJS86398.1 AAA domain-containing protein [Paracoccus sp. TOH]
MSSSISDRFEFDESAVAVGDEAALRGALWRVYDKSNGHAERLLRTWRKTGTDIDDELRSLWRYEMRQVRRLMRYRDASELIVDVLEELEDDEEFALVLAARGEPISAGARRRRSRESPIGRKRILVWRNITRLVRALGILHDQAIVHGDLSQDCIFSEDGDQPDFRLGGFEWSVRLDAGDQSRATRSMHRPDKTFSFRADWAQLGIIAADLLGLEKSDSAFLNTSSKELRVLRLLTVPRPNQPLDAKTVAREIETVILDLRRLESGRQGQLILMPNPATLGPTLIEHLGTGIDPDNFSDHCKWLQADLQSDVRVAPRFEDDQRKQCEIVTSSFRYVVEPLRHAADWRVGYLKALIPNDGRGTGAAEPRELASPIVVVPNRKEASDLSRKLGPSAIEWDQFSRPPDEDQLPTANVLDALLIIEVIEAVASTLDAFPVAVVEDASDDQCVALQLLDDDDHQALVEQAGLRPDSERLEDLLDSSDDTPWRLSNSPKLGWSGSADIDIDFIQSDYAPNGARLHVFECNEVPAGKLFLKPPRDIRTESQVRRRLRNILLLEGRTDVTVGFDDPWLARRTRFASELEGEPDSALDEPKRRALDLISQTEPYVYVVGPPGVGKTFLVSRAIKQILESKPDARILVTAQGHEALKNIQDELRKVIPQDATIIRIGNDDDRFADLDDESQNVLSRLCKSEALQSDSFRKFRLSLQETLKSTEEAGDGRHPTVSRIGDLILQSANVVVAGLNSLTISDFAEDAEEFDWLIVEEAARALGPELAGALPLAPRKILIGDHNQLPPHKAEEIARRFEPTVAKKLLGMAEGRLNFSTDTDQILPLLRALLEDDERFQATIGRANRLLEPFRTMVEEDEKAVEQKGAKHRRISVTLTEQRRMAPAIAEVVSNVFYGGDLKTATLTEARESPVKVCGKFPSEPIVVIDFPSLQSTARTENFEKRLGKSLSNPSEADEVIRAVKCIEGRAIDGNLPSLAILSPYRGQVELISQRLLIEYPTTGGPEGFRPVREDLGFVGTVDAFQGSEADVVLLSLVRNNTRVGGGGLGFLRDRRRMNVAISRAKHKLVIVSSLTFMDLASKGINPKGDNPKWAFVRNLVNELRDRNQVLNGGVRILEPGRFG